MLSLIKPVIYNTHAQCKFWWYPYIILIVCAVLQNHKRTCNRISVCIKSHHSMFTYCLYPFGAPNSPIPFHMKTALLRWFNVTRNSKPYLGLQVKSLIFFLILMKFWFFQQIFINVPNIKFHRNASSGSCTHTHRQMDMRLIGALCRYSEVPTKWTERT